MQTIYDWMARRGIPLTKCEVMETAFVHSSYCNENRGAIHDNERLEFMGDAVLQLYTTTRLYTLHPTLNEGQMTLYRSKLVSEGALASYVRQLGIAAFLRLGVGEEKTGGRDRDSILSDLMEALIGAIYLSAGFVVATQFLDSFMLPYLQNEISDLLQEDHKTKLQKFVQADTRRTVTYETIQVQGQSNAPEFEVAVKLDDIILGRGKGTSKKKAEQEAAKAALLKMVK